MSDINLVMPEDEALSVSRLKIISNFQVISDYLDSSVYDIDGGNAQPTTQIILDGGNANG